MAFCPLSSFKLFWYSTNSFSYSGTFSSIPYLLMYLASWHEVNAKFSPLRYPTLASYGSPLITLTATMKSSLWFFKKLKSIWLSVDLVFGCVWITLSPEYPIPSQTSISWLADVLSPHETSKICPFLSITSDTSYPVSPETLQIVFSTWSSITKDLSNE